MTRATNTWSTRGNERYWRWLIGHPRGTCVICGKDLPLLGRARQRLFCHNRCQQRAYRIRLVARALQLRRNFLLDEVRALKVRSQQS